MRTLYILLLLLLFSRMGFGQVFKKVVVVNKTQTFSYVFDISKDSTCYFRVHSSDNSTYYLYRGLLKRTSDTLFEFKFQTIVEFGEMERFNNYCEMEEKEKNSFDDTVFFAFSGFDTVLSSSMFKVKVGNGKYQEVELKPKRGSIPLKRGANESLFVDTKITDPLTKEKVIMIIDPCSEPEFLYYGSKTPWCFMKISGIKNKLTIYPHQINLQENEVLLLKE